MDFFSMNLDAIDEELKETETNDKDMDNWINSWMPTETIEEVLFNLSDEELAFTAVSQHLVEHAVEELDANGTIFLHHFTNSRTCYYCAKDFIDLNPCMGCNMVLYCGYVCQSKDAPEHIRLCEKLFKAKKDLHQALRQAKRCANVIVTKHDDLCFNGVHFYRSFDKQGNPRAQPAKLEDYL